MGNSPSSRANLTSLCKPRQHGDPTCSTDVESAGNTELEYLVWPNRPDGVFDPVPSGAPVDRGFSIGVFSSPSPSATRLGELYKGQRVVGVSEWHIRVGHGPFGFSFGCCSDEDTWLRLSPHDVSLPWAERKACEDLWVHMEHRHAGCSEDGVRSWQVFLIPAPKMSSVAPAARTEMEERGFASPPLELQPEPEPSITAQKVVTAWSGTPPKIRAAPPPSGTDLWYDPATDSWYDPAQLDQVDRSSTEALRPDESSMRLSNSSQVSTDEAEAEAERESETLKKALKRRKEVTARRHKEIEKEVERELKAKVNASTDKGSTGLLGDEEAQMRRELEAYGERTTGNESSKDLRAQLKQVLVTRRIADYCADLGIDDSAAVDERSVVSAQDERSPQLVSPTESQATGAVGRAGAQSRSAHSVELAPSSARGGTVPVAHLPPVRRRTPTTQP
jgi:hypothetical protein